MSESNGEPGAQSFSRVTDRHQFLEFTGTPWSKMTFFGIMGVRTPDRMHVCIALAMGSLPLHFSDHLTVRFI